MEIITGGYIMSDFKWLSKLRAKLLIKDDIQSLEFLTRELQDGSSTEADRFHWDKSLKQMKEYLPYCPEHQGLYDTFKKRRSFVDHLVRTKNLEEYTGTIMVVSSIYGLFSTLDLQRKNHEEKGDVIIVTGGWMGFEGDISSIHKAMDLVEEGVIFLKGKNEESFLEQSREDDLETLFVSSLPTDVQTAYSIITTGNSKNEPVPIKTFVNDKTPNLTGKTMIAVHPEEGVDTQHIKKQNVILLAPGDAIRLNVKNTYKK